MNDSQQQAREKIVISNQPWGEKQASEPGHRGASQPGHTEKQKNMEDTTFHVDQIFHSLQQREPSLLNQEETGDPH
ncbi:hypothetical protein MDA_GLEAN10024656 [Myotis davidii]|uniref:Uncharacterized protein n=1 Tax=Myotis davidii TaxID=225400 RepID=L5LWA5_MYODS|nr:hypothetical protein MDA_GLEAN10024656 [Myotis davidii]